MAGTSSVLKGKEKKKCIVEDVDEDEGESETWLGQEDEEEDDDSEGNEEDDGESEGGEEESEEEYVDEESESDTDEDNEFEESFDGDEEYESISEDQIIEDDANNVTELSDKVVNILRQRNQKMDVLKLEECKAYLRKHRLMISGRKAACIQRILEHWRLKDGNGERFYPKSSFTINCTGDVCKGDVVMFKQRVYEKFDKVSRHGKILGKRTLAGRIVKESYGLAKQQHTFTVEVLWSKGVKPLPPLNTLLVKGRNLYRYRTFRQAWHNEAERCKILEEKHRRGATARHVRASKLTRSHAVGTKRQRKPTTPATAKNHGTKASFSLAQSKKSKTETASFSLARSKKSKTETSSYTHPRQHNHHEIDINPLHNPARNIYENVHPHLLQRNHTAAGPQTGRARFHVPSYNYDYITGHAVAPLRMPLHHHHHHQYQHHHHQMMEQANYISRPYAGHASLLPPRENLGRPYSAFVSQYDSRRSGDNNFPWR